MLDKIPELDLCVIGEAERTLPDILLHLKDRSWAEVPGLCYRNPDHGGVNWSPARPLLTEEELDQLPYPFWDILPMEVYLANSPLALSPQAVMCKRRLDVISERGCPMRCTFCWHNMMGGGKVRFQSPEYVVGMVMRARLKYGIDFVSFLDENMLSNRKRTERLCDLLIENDLPKYVSWGCLGHPKDADPSLFEKMRDAGCTYVSYGGESADQRMLDSINKKSTVADLHNALQTTKRALIQPVMTFMVGYPGEDLQSLYNTMKFWMLENVRCLPFFITPYPGSQLYVDSALRILDEWGSLEEFVLHLGDATDLVANLTQFTDVELLGLRDLISTLDERRFLKHAALKGVTIDTSQVERAIRGSEGLPPAAQKD